MLYVSLKTRAGLTTKACFAVMFCNLYEFTLILLENLNDLLHADSDEEVVDGPDNDDFNGDQIAKDMDAADGKVVI